MSLNPSAPGFKPKEDEFPSLTPRADQRSPSSSSGSSWALPENLDQTAMKAEAKVKKEEDARKPRFKDEEDPTDD
jgi:hypothetical protein